MAALRLPPSQASLDLVLPVLAAEEEEEKAVIAAEPVPATSPTTLPPSPRTKNALSKARAATPKTVQRLTRDQTRQPPPDRYPLRARLQRR